MKTKFVVIDPGLNRLGGHNYTLAVTFSAAAHAMGHHVVWLCHTKFPTELAPRYVQAKGVFPLSYYKKSNIRWNLVRIYDRLGRERPSMKPWGRRVYPFVKEMAAALKDLGMGPADHVFITTAEYLQYAALLELLSAESHEELPFFHIRTSYAESAALNLRFGARLPALFRRFRDLGLVGRRVFFYGETPELAAHFGAWNLVPFEVMGNPVPQAFLDAPTRAGGTDKTLTIVCPGQARVEKGYLRLPGIVAALWARKDVSRPVRFVLHSNFRNPAKGDRPRRKDRDRHAARDALKAFPEGLVQLVERPLSNDEYYASIADADIVLLPYDADIYRVRPSMIASEAALFGKPVAVTAGTTLAQFVAPGTGETASSDTEFANGLARIINDYDTYRAKAEARAATMRQDLDPRVLVRRMVARATPPRGRACIG